MSDSISGKDFCRGVVTKAFLKGNIKISDTGDFSKDWRPVSCFEESKYIDLFLKNQEKDFIEECSVCVKSDLLDKMPEPNDEVLFCSYNDYGKWESEG